MEEPGGSPIIVSRGYLVQVALSLGFDELEAVVEGDGHSEWATFFALRSVDEVAAENQLFERGSSVEWNVFRFVSSRSNSELSSVAERVATFFKARYADATLGWAKPVVTAAIDGT